MDNIYDEYINTINESVEINDSENKNIAVAITSLETAHKNIGFLLNNDDINKNNYFIKVRLNIKKALNMLNNLGVKK